MDASYSCHSCYDTNYCLECCGEGEMPNGETCKSCFGEGSCPDCITVSAISRCRNCVSPDETCALCAPEPSNDLDPRTVHMTANKPTSRSRVYDVNFSGPNRGMAWRVSSDLPELRRYGALLTKKGNKYVGKIITHLDISDWAKMKGYEIVSSMRFKGRVNKETECTEIQNLGKC